MNDARSPLRHSTGNVEEPFILLAVLIRHVAPIAGLMPANGGQNVVLDKAREGAS
jgi:hypothetical protein